MKTPTLYEAVEGFLGPLMAEYCRLIEEGSDDAPVTIMIGNYPHKTTLKAIKDLDRAHRAAFEAKCKRDEKRSRGTLL